MLSQTSFRSNISLYLSKLLLQSTLHPLFYSLLVFIRILQILSLTQDYQFTKYFQYFILKCQTIQNSQLLLILLFVFQLIFICLLVIGFIINRNKQKDNITNIVNIKYQTFGNILITKLTCYLLIIFRVIVIMPLTVNSFTVIQHINSPISSNLINTENKYGGFDIFLACINLIFFYLIIYPLSGLTFLNKIIIKRNILSYAYLLNLQTLVYLYLPLLSLICSITSISTILCYLNILFSLFCLVCIYYHPIITLNFTKTSQINCSFLIGTIFITGIYKLFLIDIKNIGDILFFLLMNLGIAIIIYGVINNRIKNKILEKYKNQNIKRNVNDNNTIIASDNKKNKTYKNKSQKQYNQSSIIINNNNNYKDTNRISLFQSQIQQQSQFLSQGQDQLLFFYIINFKKYKDLLILFVLNFVGQNINYTAVDNLNVQNNINANINNDGNQKSIPNITINKDINKYKQQGDKKNQQFQDLNINVENKQYKQNMMSIISDVSSKQSNSSNNLSNNQSNSLNQKKNKKVNAITNKNIIQAVFQQVSQKSLQHQKLLLKLQKTIQSIISLLNSQSQNQNQIQNHFYQLIILKLKLKYDSQSIIKSKNLGKNDIITQLNHYPKYYIFLSQIVLLKKQNKLKSYFLLKIQQNLLKHVQRFTFINQIEISSLLMIIEDQLSLQRKINKSKSYNFNAENYFIFQQKYQNLKNAILESTKICLLFWTELQYDQPDVKKVNKLIEKNYSCSVLIQSIYNKLLTQFQRKSPLILLQTIVEYSSIVLNSKIPSIMSPFNNLISKVKQQIQLQKRQGQSKIQIDKSTTIYSLMNQEIGVCLVDFQNNQGFIEWANEQFWVNYYGGLIDNDNSKKMKSITSKKSQQYKYLASIKKRYIFDILIPQLRYKHKTKYMPQLSNGYNFNLKHSDILLYKQKNKHIQRSFLQIQIFPSIKTGLKLSLFFRKLPEQQSQQLDLVIKQNLQFVGWSKNFQIEKNQMLEIQNNMIEQNQICQTLFKHQQFKKLFETIKTFKTDFKKLSQQEKSIQIRCQNSDYKVHLRNFYPYYLEQDQYNNEIQKYKNNQSQFINKNNLNNSINSKRYIIHLQFINLLQVQNYQQKQQKQALLAKFLSKASNNQGQQSEQIIHSKDHIKQKSKFTLKNYNNMENFYSSGSTASNFGFGNRYGSSFNNVNVPSLTLENKIIHLPVQMTDKIQTKTQQSIKLDRKYTSLISQKTPKRIIVWRYTTTILMIIVLITIIVNIFISVYKKQTYNQNKLIIKEYNQLITDTSQILIALREYNYFAYINNLSNVTVNTQQINDQITKYIKKLQTEESQIANKMKGLTQYLNDKWIAFEFLQSGFSKTVTENDYVVIANYLLGSVSYLSRINATQLNFPILMSNFNWWKGLSSAQANFLEAVFNGIYSCMVNMKSKRITVVQNIQKIILPIDKQLFIFPTIIAVVMLLVFSIFSIYIEVKSQNVKKDIYRLLSFVNTNLRIQKVKSLTQFLLNKDIFVDQNAKNSKSQVLFDFMTRTMEGFPQKKKNKFKNNQKQRGSIMISQLTGRQLIENNLQQNTTHKTQQNNTQIINLSNLGQKQQNTNDKLDQNIKYKVHKKDKIIQKRQQINNKSALMSIYTASSTKLKILFYFFICLPFLIYFMVMLIGGIFLNNDIMYSLKLSSDLYNRKTNLQYVYLWTSETALYQKDILGHTKWGLVIMELIDQSYIHQRDVDRMVKQLNSQSYLRKYLSMLEKISLCQILDQFQKSEYYKIQFTKLQCQSIGYSIMSKGLKNLIVFYLQNAVQLIQRYPNAGSMTQEQRGELLDSQQLSMMKIILVYLQQILDISMVQFEKDLQKTINDYIQMTIIYSSVSALLIVTIFIAIHFRWKLLIKQRKLIKSIIGLISFQSVKKYNLLSKQFKQLNCQFYQ